MRFFVLFLRSYWRQAWLFPSRASGLPSPPRRAPRRCRSPRFYEIVQHEIPVFEGASFTAIVGLGDGPSEEDKSLLQKSLEGWDAQAVVLSCRERMSKCVLSGGAVFCRALSAQRTARELGRTGGRLELQTRTPLNRSMVHH